MKTITNIGIKFLGILTILVAIPMSSQAEDMLQCELARLSMEDGVYQHAVVMYQACIRDGDLTDKNKSNAYSQLAISRILVKQFDEAKLDIEKATALDPKNAKIFLSKGFLMQKTKSYQGAIKAFTKAIELDSKLAPAYRERGKAYLSKMSVTQSPAYIPKAYRDLKKALTLSENDGETHRLMGTLLVAKKQYKSALRHFNKAVKLQPGRLVNVYARGITHLKNGNYKLAINDMDVILAQNPEFVQAKTYRRRAIQKSVAKKRAPNNQDFGYSNNSSDKSAEFNQAKSYLARNNLKKAETFVSRAINSNANDIDAYILRAQIFIKGQRANSAIQDISRAIDLGARHLKVYKLRAQAYMQSTKYEKAISDLTKVLTFDRKDVDSYINRGIAYSKIGLNHKAVNDFNKALAIEPSNNVALIHKQKISKIDAANKTQTATTQKSNG